MTIRNFLHKELEKREVKVESERSYKRAPVEAALEKLRFLIAESERVAMIKHIMSGSNTFAMK